MDSILKGNTLIAEIMERTFENLGIRIAKYHSSWEWLMPVIEKISKIPLLNADDTLCTDPVDTCYPITFNMPTEDGKVMFRFKGFSVHTADKLIDAAWNAVVEVCEYHNTIKNKK